MSHVTERPRNAERRMLTPAHTGHVSAGTDRRLIVGVDDSASGTAALRWAIARARREPALLVAVRSWALGLSPHGGRHHRHPLHPHVVLYFDGSERRAASAKLALRALRAAAVSDYLTGHARCPVVVVPTMNEASS